MTKEIKYIEVYWIAQLQNIFITGFCNDNNLERNDNNDNHYIIELNYKGTKNSKDYLYNICDINKVYFKDENSLNNFKSTRFDNLPIY